MRWFTVHVTTLVAVWALVLSRLLEIEEIAGAGRDDQRTDNRLFNHGARTVAAVDLRQYRR